MSNQTSSNPVKVPPSAANNSAATLDTELRSQINTVLLKEGHIAKIQDQLLHSLHANQANWPTLIQNHALNLLRSGEVTTFPALLRRVLDDVRQDTLNPSSTTSPSTSKTNGTTAGGAEKDKKTNGATSTPTPAAGAAADPNTPPNLAIPAAVIEDAIKVTRESLEAVCDVVDETSGS